MKIKSLRIENFKCFKTPPDIEFGNLTLLTGANSSGKSSIIYSILGAIQSGEFPFQFSTNGKYVDMGDFREIVHNHNRHEKIKIGFQFIDSDLLKIETFWIENKDNNLPKLFELKAESSYYNLNINLRGKKYVVDFKYIPEKDPLKEYYSSGIYKKFADIISESISVIGKGQLIKLEGNKGIVSYFDDFKNETEIKGLTVDEIPISLDNVNTEKKGQLKLKQILDVISKRFNTFDNSISFISSFRLAPNRTYLEKSRSKLKVDQYGDGYLDQIILWETKDKAKFNELIEMLKEMKLLHSVRSKRLDGGRYEVAVQVKKDGIETSLTDVGFGISQFLPIVVADLQLPDASTLFIAQPEIHLHPSVQSTFGDYLTKQIKTKSKNYVIETHSEYLLNKIRLAIVKGELDEDEVKVLFIDEDSTIHKVGFNKQGQILNAPNNFFQTYMLDVMDIAINATE